MQSFSPFEPTIFASIFLSLPIFYLLGSFFTPRLSTPWRNISARIAMGVFVFTTLMAVIHAGIHTLLFPFLCFLPFLFVHKPIGVWGDLEAVGKRELSTWFTVCLLLTFGEMYLFDIRQAQNIFIGNWDYAYSGGFGFDFYSTGVESSRTFYQPNQNRVLHHFGDHWLAGFYSYYLGVLPYYSYAIVYRTLGEIILLSLVFSWAAPLLKSTNRLFLLLIGLSSLGLNTLEFLPGLDTVSTTWGLNIGDDNLWNYGPYYLFAVGIALFGLWVSEQKIVLGTIGWMLLSLFHPAAMLVEPVAVTIVVVFYLIFPRLSTQKLPLYKLGLLGIVSWVPFLYASIDGRMYQSTLPLLDIHFITAVGHTFIQLLVSAIFIAPLGWGVWVLAKRTSYWLFLLHLGAWVGIVVSHSLIHTLMNGDSEQIYLLYKLAILTPTGVIGLFIGVLSSKKTKRYVSLFFLVLSLGSSYIRQEQIFTHTSLKGGFYHNMGYDAEWINLSKISTNEAKKVCEMLDYGTLTDVVYAQDPYSDCTEFGFLIHHSFLRGLVAGTELHRVNILPVDTFTGLNDKPRQRFFERSLLNHCSQKNDFDDGTSRCMTEILKPSYLLLDTAYTPFYLPKDLRQSFTKFDTLGRFILVSKPIQR
jgi:hypothetical protein